MSKRAWRGPILGLAVGVASVWTVNCQDGFATIDPPPDSTGIVSDRVVDASLSTASVTEDVVFVSLPPGAILLGMSDISTADGLDPASLQRALTPLKPSALMQTLVPTQLAPTHDLGRG